MFTSLIVSIHKTPEENILLGIFQCLFMFFEVSRMRLDFHKCPPSSLYSLRNTSSFYLAQSTLGSRCIAFATSLSSLPVVASRLFSTRRNFLANKAVSSPKSTSLQATDTVIENSIKILS